MLVCLAGRADESSAGPLRFSEVYLGFASEHAADLVSGFGHAFVCLPERPVSSADELLTAPAVNFAADASGVDGVWQARFRLRTCYELLRANTFFQQRDVYFIRLKLDEPAKRRLADGLARRTGRVFPYDFFRNNCGANLAEWILEAAGHSEKVIKPWVYVTPRESIERVVDTVGAEGLLVVGSSASRVAARVAVLGPSAAEQARAAIRDASLTEAIEDLWLRLEVIRLNESRVEPDAYQQLQILRNRTLEEPDGAKAAQDMGRSTNAGLLPMSAWVKSAEGPGVTVGLVGDGSGRVGVRLGIEAGLRDAHTPPYNGEVRREAHLLGLEVDQIDGNFCTKATLIAMHSERNLPGVFGGGSSGFEVGYIDRPNAEGAHGVHLESWSGVYARWADSSWMGIRVMLQADELQGAARIRMVPSLSSSTKFGQLDFIGVLVVDRGSIGYRLEAGSSTSGFTTRVGLERDASGRQRFSTVISTRF